MRRHRKVEMTQGVPAKLGPRARGDQSAGSYCNAAAVECDDWRKEGGRPR